MNRLATSTDPLGRTEQYQYDLNGNLIRKTKRDGVAVDYVYDAANQLVQKTSPSPSTGEGGGGGVSTTTYTYSANGNLQLVADNDSSVFFVYDPLDRVLWTESSVVGSPNYSVILYTYDLAGNRLNMTADASRVTAYRYDVMNRLVSVTDALDHLTTYSYDASGNLTSVTDAKGSVTTFSYDSMNRLASSTDALGRTESYLYDLNGNLIRKVKRDGATLDFLYDPANQLVQKTSSSAHPEPVEGPNITTYTYDLNGNLTSVTDPDSSLSFAYDSLDRVIRAATTQPVNSVVEYGYDVVGNRLTMTQLAPDPSPLTTTYSYDPVNRLVQLSNPESQAWNFQYDLAGRRTDLFHPNNIVTHYSYDAASRLLSLHHDQSGSPVAHFDYAYDAVGNRIQKFSPSPLTGEGAGGGETTYTYDALNRLTSAATTVPGLPQEFYSYDAVGSRVTSYLSNLHVHDAANQLLEDQQFFYSYDPNGNQTSKTAKDGSERWTYTYDAENQLVGVQRFAPAWVIAPTMTASYSYDGMGRRIAKNISGITGSLAPGLTTYVYDNEDILSFNGTKITHGPDVDEPLQVGNLTLLQDGLGSIVAEISSLGMSRLSFESYGSTKPPPSTPYGFTGREFDPESGLNFHRARYYDPTSGTFIQQDPFGSLTPTIFPVNKYSYASLNPTNLVDPFGDFNIPGLNTVAEKLIKDQMEFLAPGEFTPQEKEKVARELRKEVTLTEGSEALKNIADPSKNIPLAEDIIRRFRERVSKEGTPEEKELLKKAEKILEGFKKQLGCK